MDQLDKLISRSMDFASISSCKYGPPLRDRPREPTWPAPLRGHNYGLLVVGQRRTQLTSPAFMSFIKLPDSQPDFRPKHGSSVVLGSISAHQIGIGFTRLAAAKLSRHLAQSGACPPL